MMPAPIHFPSTEPRPFSEAVQLGDVLYLSGQIGSRPDGTLPEDFEEQIHQLMRNIAAVLERRQLGLGDVFKVTVMLSDMSLWERFNSVYVDYFSSGRLPARSAFGTAGLALGAAAEVECLACVRVGTEEEE